MVQFDFQTEPLPAGERVGDRLALVEGYISLGSNLGDRWAHLRAGVRGLERAGLELLALSSVWETEPIDSAPPWYLNMVVSVRAVLQPLELLDTLLDIERQAGRVRSTRNAPRTLDLDLLLLGDLEVRKPRLHLPHPRMWQRRFVLEPLAEIAPELRNPATGRTAVEERRLIAGHGQARRLGSLPAC